MYLGWALFVEGGSDREYLEALIPRVLEYIVSTEGLFEVEIPLSCSVPLGSNGRDVESVAAEACDARDAFEIVFIHADTGGRNLEDGIQNRGAAYIQRMNDHCNLRIDRSVLITPRHEVEAWILADRKALLKTLGYRDDANNLGLPTTATAAERIVDPKASLMSAIATIYGRRKSKKRRLNFSAVAINQNIATLRGSDSFSLFEENLRTSLRTFGIIRTLN